MNDLFSNKILFVKKNINISELLERNFMALRKTKNSGKATPKKITKEPKHAAGGSHNFHIEFKNEYQSLAWAAFQQHDVLFLTGPAGSGKSHLATAFALEQVLNRKRKKIILTRPVVEAGESLGFLPGEFADKIQPYMMPLFDCIESMVGTEGLWKDRIDEAIEVAPIAFMRGRSILNTENLITPTGLKPMGEIKVGDFVIGSDGKPTKVLGVYPQGELPIFEIKFSDGTKSICSGDHLWNTMTLNEKRYGKGYTTKSTNEIRKNVKNKHNQKIHRMPIISAPVEFEKQEVSVDPYLLGVLLGDGHMNKGFSVTSADPEIIEECSKVLPNGHMFVHKGKYDYRIQSNNKLNKIKIDLMGLELWGKKSPEKFIPNCYKFNDYECRLSVLQGLLDTHGWICKHRSGNCRIQFCSTSKALADDVMFLTRSLGGMAYSRVRDFEESDSHEHNGKIIRHVHSSHNVDIILPVCPFRLSRKAEQYSNNQNSVKMISSIEEVGKGMCTCIQVDAKDHLYLTNDFIVTHNTFNDAICILDEAQNCSMMQLKLFLTRFGENSKVIITGDPTQSDIGGKVALVEVMQKLKDVNGVGIVEFKENAIVRHPLVGRIIEKLS